VGIDDASERLEQLIQTGKARGYVLYDEIDELLTQVGDAHLDIALTELAVNGIEILEEPGAGYDAGLTNHRNSRLYCSCSISIRSLRTE
jgi:Sigma-70 factor, region 1.1